MADGISDGGAAGHGLNAEVEDDEDEDGEADLFSAPMNFKAFETKFV